jgi:hypothetical protein
VKFNKELSKLCRFHKGQHNPWIEKIFLLT